jgi:hypothetical protein
MDTVSLLTGFAAGSAVTGICVGGTFMMFRRKKSAPFKVRVTLVDKPLPTFLVEAMGDLKNKEEAISYKLELVDYTGHRENPMRWDLGRGEQETDSIQISSDNIVVPRKHTIEKWERIALLPVEKIKFGRKGLRELRFRIKVEGTPVSGVAVMEYVQIESGFEEVESMKYDFYSSLWYLIAGFRQAHEEKGSRLLVGAAEWLLNESAVMPPQERNELFERFRCVAESDPPVVTWEAARGSYVAVIRENSNRELREKIIRVFYSSLIEGSEEKVGDEELQIMYDLCVAIGEDMRVFSNMVDRVILRCDVKKHPAEVLLGLHDGLSVEQKNKRLREEYGKWNERITHPEKEISDRAKVLMDHISRLRGELKRR